MTSRTVPDEAAPVRSTATAYPLLVLAALMWAGNAVAGKWAVGEVSPQALTTLRWTFGLAALAIVARGEAAEARRVFVAHWRTIVLLAGSGFTAFASLLYLAGAFTTASNVALFQGSIPVIVILLNFLVRRVRVSVGQIAGTGVTLAGVAVAATHGDWSVLTHFTFNLGDGLMLGACLFYAAYTVGLASRPKVSALAFFTAMAFAAVLTSAVPLAAEWATGHLRWPTAKGWAIVAFVALGPTLAAQFAFMRGVELIGPNRAGLFVNLVPIFGALLAVLLAGEAFGTTQALALALVLGGIALAEWFRPRPAP